jgi:hypothetical protein
LLCDLCDLCVKGCKDAKYARGPEVLHFRRI